tara:strand:- start:158 stop:442 length:285 start_codon:yes stop_codon:yes gene_type:complete
MPKKKKSSKRSSGKMRRNVNYKYLDNKINECSKMIVMHGDKADDYALGKMNILMSFRRQATHNDTMYDKGIIDGVNDVLSDLGYVGKGKIFMDF